MGITDWLPALLTLTAMEIVLGIDNILFIAIVAGRLPAAQQGRARVLGLALALAGRLLLLLTLSWMLSLTRPVFALSDLGLPGHWLPRATDEVSWRDLFLLAGGLFLIGKGTREIHHKLEGRGEGPAARAGGGLAWALAQIVVLDLVFSVDSVITAIGMARADQLWVMVTAMVLAVGVMLAFAGPVSRFIHRHPTLQMLALSFLILIGVMLVADGVGQHIERGYVYFAMAFATAVELLNLRLLRRRTEAATPVPARPAPAADRIASRPAGH